MANKWGIPFEVEAAVLQRDRQCVYCQSPFTNERAKKRSWEHIINDASIVTLDNIALCCVGCNASKGAKPLKVWLESEAAIRRGISASTLSPVVKEALDKILRSSACPSAA